ncbi:hypothetical protein [Paenibacillus sp. J2TS4]|uniref:hypothetical protein n=1 Tax=Paenibacillus sp. J2TS4 TaxID=2807194 RepID=UPI001B043397|nr:hypothetical protein [Paenibacillus sp. J2TS4]GIP35138.1 hypothetical protein J2TS4_43480 [Paenibacillus sp. J2TS4]
MKRSIAFLMMSLLLMFSVAGASATPSVSTSSSENTVARSDVWVNVTAPVGTFNNPAGVYAPFPHGLTVTWNQYSSNPGVSFPEVRLFVYDPNSGEIVYDSGVYPNLNPNSNSSYYHIPILPQNRLLEVHVYVFASDGRIGGPDPQFFIMK